MQRKQGAKPYLRTEEKAIRGQMLGSTSILFQTLHRQVERPTGTKGSSKRKKKRVDLLNEELGGQGLGESPVLLLREKTGRKASREKSRNGKVR